MRVVVQIVGGPSANKRFVLQRGQEATFGRTQNADHAFPEDPRMSSVHFLLRLSDAGCLVRDNNSTNGTFVDDQRVVERPLTSNCTIRAGDTRFSVTLAEIEMAQFTGPPASAGASTGPSGVSAPTISAPRPAPFEPNRPLQRTPPQIASSPVATLRAEAGAPAPTNRTTQPAPATEKWRSLATKEYEIAADDEDAIVRRGALIAAAWNRQKWVLEWCRFVSTRPDPKHWDGLLLLAILGQSDDLARVQTIGGQASLGPQRFSILGAYGHPRALTDIVASVGAKDEMDAFAARAAFTKITGLEVPLKAAPGAKQDSAPTADTDAAILLCRDFEQRFPGAFRICRGYDVSRGVLPEALDSFDLESRWEACLRGRYQNTWKASPLDNQQLADALTAAP